MKNIVNYVFLSISFIALIKDPRFDVLVVVPKVIDFWI